MSQSLKVRHWGHTSRVNTNLTIEEDTKSAMLKEISRISELSLLDILPDARILSSKSDLELGFDSRAVCRIQFVSQALDFAEKYLTDQIRLEVKRELEEITE